MKVKSIVLCAALSLTMAGQALASESGIIYKEAASEDSSYCHIKYMAFKLESLRNPQPEFNPSDVVDRYGACDFNPNAQQEVQKQLQAAHYQEISPNVGGQGND